MTLPTLRELQDLARETGFLQNPLEKVIRLAMILERVGRHPYLKERLVLKGGSALNLFHFPLSRLSIDVDLNYTGSLARKGMLADRGRIGEILEGLFSREYRIAVGKDEFALTQYELRYFNLAGASDKLKIEINYLHRTPMAAVVPGRLRELGAEVVFPLLGLEEIAASKLIALQTRHTPRDLFDIYQIARAESILEMDLARDLAVYYGLISRVSLFDLIETNLEVITDHQVRRTLYPLLVRRSRPDRGRMIDCAVSFATRLLSLKPAEKAAIEAFYRTGELELEAIFTKRELRDKIRVSPPFLWKARHVKRHARG